MILRGSFDHKEGCRAPDYGECTCAALEIVDAVTAERERCAQIAELGIYPWKIAKLIRSGAKPE